MNLKYTKEFLGITFTSLMYTICFFMWLYVFNYLRLWFNLNVDQNIWLIIIVWLICFASYLTYHIKGKQNER